jgi:hypothetical protein
MAIKKATSSKVSLNEKKRNKGVHAQNKTSQNPNSKNYKKSYRGQGR